MSRMVGAKISRALLPGAMKLDTLFGRLAVGYSLDSAGALPFRSTPGESTLRVGEVESGVVRVLGKSLHITESGLHGQIAFRNHKKLSKFIEAWGKSRGWLGAEGSIWDLNGYLTPDRLAFAIWDKYVNNVKAVAMGGRRFGDVNVRADITVAELTKIADKIYAPRSEGWLRVYDYFTPTSRMAYDKEAILIANAFEDVAFELPDAVWQCFAEFVISNGEWDGFVDAVNLVAGSLGE